MADPVADYQRAADGFAAVLASAVAGGGLDGQSPCAEWKGSDVVEHVLVGTARFTELFGGTVPEAPAADSDPVDVYAARRAALVDAASQPGVLDRVVQGPLGGDLPASVLLGIYTTDTLLHTWDLARACGNDVELDGDLLHRSWQNAIPLDERLREQGRFGPKVDVGPDATAQQQALAFFGRDAR